MKKFFTYLTIKFQGDCGVDNVFINVIPERSMC